MPTSAIAGLSGILYASSSAIGSSGAPITSNQVLELQDVTLSLAAEYIPAFSKDSSGWDEGIRGKRSYSLSGKAIYRDTTGSTGQISLLIGLMSTAASYNTGFSLKAAASSGTLYFSGGGIVTKWDLSQPLDGADTYDFTLQGTRDIGIGTSSGT